MPFIKNARRRPTALDRTTTQRRHRPDYVLLLIMLVLLTIGLTIIYAISPGLGIHSQVGGDHYVKRQFMAIGLGLAVFLVVANIRYSAWRYAQRPLILAALASAAAVQLFGEEVNGAVRWIHIGGLSFQSVELIKFAVLIWLAGFLTDRLADASLNSWRQTLKPLLILLILIGGVVAVLQSDFGSAAVVVAIVASMVYVAGLPLRRVILVGLLLTAAATLLLAFGPDYRRDRIATLLNPERDCQNVGYHACQALIAIGSGGVFGRGVGQSVQAYGYTPEAANDSTFAIHGEMFGFVGSIVLIGLFIALFTRIKNLMERAPDSHARLLLAGVLAWLSTQALINIGSMIGMLPLKGITLPFISYGGTSMVFSIAAIGLVFNVSKYSKYRVSGLEQGKPESKRTHINDSRRVVPGYVTRKRVT